jgi:hypothetical protein
MQICIRHAGWVEIVDLIPHPPVRMQSGINRVHTMHEAPAIYMMMITGKTSLQVVLGQYSDAGRFAVGSSQSRYIARTYLSVLYMHASNLSITSMESEQQTLIKGDGRKVALGTGLQPS